VPTPREGAPVDKRKVSTLWGVINGTSDRKRGLARNARVGRVRGQEAEKVGKKENSDQQARCDPLAGRQKGRPVRWKKNTQAWEESSSRGSENHNSVSFLIITTEQKRKPEETLSRSPSKTYSLPDKENNVSSS